MPIRIKRRSKRLPTKIKDWRKYHGITQKQLGEAMDTSGATISRVETGKQPYTQDFLEWCAEVLFTTPAALIERDPPEHKVVEFRPRKKPLKRA